MAHIYKRRRTWWIDYGIVAGRELRRSLKTPSKKLAQEILTDYLARRTRGEHIPGLVEDIAFDDLATRYLELVTPQKSPSTQDRDRYTVDHLKAWFGKTPVREISAEGIEAYQARRLATPRAGRTILPATVNRETQLLRAMLRRAREWGYLREVPRIGQIRLPETEPRFLTPEQAQRLMDTATGQMKTFVTLALNTGLRKSELYNLTWDCVRFEQRQLLIPKTKGQRFRAVEMNDQVLEVLGAHPHHPESPHVLHNPDGTRWHDIRRSYETLLHDAGVPRIRIHDLKHTFVSALILAGEDLRVVQEAAGHRDIRTTMRYAHLAPGRVKAAVSRLTWGRTADQPSQNQA